MSNKRTNRFRRKPLEVDAVQFRADAPIDEWPEDVTPDPANVEDALLPCGSGELPVPDGAWIITFESGNRYWWERGSWSARLGPFSVAVHRGKAA